MMNRLRLYQLREHYDQNYSIHKVAQGHGFPGQDSKKVDDSWCYGNLSEHTKPSG